MDRPPLELIINGGTYLGDTEQRQLARYALALEQGYHGIAHIISGKEGDFKDCDEGCACIPSVADEVGLILDRFGIER